MTLTLGQAQTFADQGYLVIEGLLDETDLAPVRREYKGLLPQALLERHVPSFVLRSATDPHAAVDDPAVYAARWEETRQKLLRNEIAGPLYEQARWLANRDHPVCA